MSAPTLAWLAAPQGGWPALGRPGGRPAWQLALFVLALSLPAAAQVPPAVAASAVRPVIALRVALVGTMGQQAVLVIDGGAPRGLKAGESLRGVRLVSVGASDAVIEVEGQRHTLVMGAAPQDLAGINRAAAAGGGPRQIVLQGDARGHFTTPGSINGRGVQFLVDTGATVIAIGKSEADRLGLPYQQGQRVGLRTANGEAVGWRVSLTSVRIGEVEIYNVDAVVQPAEMPFILLGNSFLTRFQMKRENDTLTLDRRF
ncbi:retropepsin-like aspartic protease family protein [Caldimonas sp. KR1-144]|uniref:retropepsin-like aspartic protease family protein n=1 Tax=Caldimonas sp. KR1-144 TaxID=3400911 RepID=UPI003C04F124